MKSARRGYWIRPQAVSWTGLGLVGGGMLLALVDAVRFSAEGADLETANHTPWWWVSVLLGALVLVPVVWRDLRDSDPAGPAERHRWGHVVFLVVVSTLSVGVTVTSFSAEPFVAMVQEPRDYEPDPVGVSLWLVPLSISLGLVLSVAAGYRPRLIPASGSMPFFAAGLVLVVLFEFALRAATLYQPTQHTVADAFPETPAPVPTDVTQVGWTWAPPEDVAVRAVEPGPLGPLLVLDDGVVALDGASGAELWSYRHPYSQVSARVVEDGARAVITRRPPADQYGDRRVTEIDTATGHVTRESAVPSLRSEDEELRLSFLAATADLRFYEWRATGEPYRISARPTRSSEEAWAFTSPDDDGRICVADYGWRAQENVLLVGDHLVVLYGCTGLEQMRDEQFVWDVAGDPEASFTVTAAALDTGTGEVVWEHEWEASGENDFELDTHHPRPGGDAGPVVVVESNHGWGLPRVLDPGEGTPVSDVPPELMVSDTDMAEGFEGLVHADSASTILLARDEDGWEGEGRPPWEFVRASPAGKVTGTALLPEETVYFDNVETAVMLGDAVAVLTPKPRDEAQDELALSAAVVGFGNEVGEIVWIELSEEHSSNDFAEDTWEDRARLLPVPGAVIAHVHDTEPAVVYGLVG
ncbi:ABC transporter ATP-binding protein [Nocardiopsis sp. EMB25]|uniref:ABC transporter ATP-binding protein n=1 Tax=Nocardiopsis sp. EMB25 TaxID=2835867 RepID=UPI002283344D|nr:ABC transporter ATP-binding protein [Nocardiopsis sp. EMB25]MCY9784349.1 ABC transporter ATP-binding protein [Nocardiopsis sp. EMB25]